MYSFKVIENRAGTEWSFLMLLFNFGRCVGKKTGGQLAFTKKEGVSEKRLFLAILVITKR